jgi:hypothetical protein
MLKLLDFESWLATGSYSGRTNLLLFVGLPAKFSYDITMTNAQWHGRRGQLTFKELHCKHDEVCS